MSMSSISKIKSMLILAGTIVGLLQILSNKIVRADENLKEVIGHKASKNILISQNATDTDQPLNGLWIGTFTQNHHPRLWNIRMKLSQNGKNVEGTSTHEPITDEQVSVVYELKGIFANKTFNFMEGKLLDRVAPPNWYLCNINGKMDLSYTQSSETLKGYWECFTQDQRHFGKIFLRKQ
jgi:hypothetical protein